MRKDKEGAIKLRRQGKSYQEIVDTLGVPKSTLSNWFSTVAWSKKTKKILSDISRKNASVRMTQFGKKRAIELRECYTEKKFTAVKQFEKYKKDILFVSGLMIYWGEGDSKLENGSIRVANSDPLMIKLFYRFLIKYFPEISDKAKIYLVLYPDIKEEECRKYWSKIVGLDESRFIKSSFIKGKTPSKRLAHGIGTIVINSRAYKEKIITWVQMIKQE